MGVGMRRYIKKEMLQILSSLEKAEEILKKSYKCGKQEETLELFADMQQAAIEIGNILEKDPQTEFVVPILEEYCELLWECSQAESQDAAAKACKRIGRKRIQATNRIKYDIEERYEVVFLPYKASMWDSLESVWLAAREDKRCDAYVIPVPYYDKKQDGTNGDMHYEGDMLPDYVPVTYYKAYDIASRRPEVIYFHNPYDDCNYVTSVHPQFYSKELKAYTDLLVYIPYFVDADDRVGEHFCSVPGVIHADRVIVQSEKVKETYVNIWMDIMGSEQKEKEKVSGGRDKGYWDALRKKADEKFLALGSPKFDKVMSAKKEDYELPKEWERIVGGRKIVLYNTSIQSLLNNREKYLDKMESVFSIFKEQKEVVLWWRPHPLNEATVTAMLPRVFERYKEIIWKYQTEGYGIYDDTPDPNRAIAVSDAYYGDGGSLLAMYKLTGKPIMLQNIDIIDDAEEG